MNKYKINIIYGEDDLEKIFVNVLIKEINRYFFNDIDYTNMDSNDLLKECDID